MRRARLLVVQHEDDAPAAWFGEWLEASGVELVALLGHRGDSIPETLEGYDGLLVLGGAMGAYDDGRCPWLTPTKRLIADTVRRGERPFLGICLGHQLAAVALGGVVVRNPLGRALGLTPIRLTEAGCDDSWLGLIAPNARAVQWNDDVVTTLPPALESPGREAQVLALAPDGTIQAARFGPLAWGVQFHPEVSPEVFASWGRAEHDGQPVDPDPAAVDAAARDVAAAEHQLWVTWQPMAERFATLMAARPAHSDRAG